MLADLWGPISVNGVWREEPGDARLKDQTPQIGACKAFSGREAAQPSDSRPGREPTDAHRVDFDPGDAFGGHLIRRSRVRAVNEYRL
jgi:hypothetical protein